VGAAGGGIGPEDSGLRSFSAAGVRGEEVVAALDPFEDDVAFDVGGEAGGDPTESTDVAGDGDEGECEGGGPFVGGELEGGGGGARFVFTDEEEDLAFGVLVDGIAPGVVFPGAGEGEGESTEGVAVRHGGGS